MGHAASVPGLTYVAMTTAHTGYPATKRRTNYIVIYIIYENISFIELIKLICCETDVVNP
jgi:hypothetical protein